MKLINIMAVTAFFIFVTQHRATAQIELEEGLIAFYPFNGDANDESGNNFNSIQIDEPTLSLDCAGKPNSAYLFNGVNDYIELSNYDDLNFSSSSIFTIALWIKAPIEQVDLDGSVNDFITKWDGRGSTPYPFNIGLFNQSTERSGRISAGQYDTNTCGNIPVVMSAVRVNDAKWHHVVFMRDEQALLKLYIDGVIQGSIVSNVRCNLANNSNILFGLRHKDLSEKRAFTGSLDNVRFYNRTMTEDEIQYLYDKELTGTEELVSVPEILVFPNPVVEGKLIIRNPSQAKIERIQIFNSIGQEVILEKDVTELNIQGLRTGIYYVRISIKGGKFVIRKITNVNLGRA